MAAKISRERLSPIGLTANFFFRIQSHIGSGLRIMPVLEAVADVLSPATAFATSTAPGSSLPTVVSKLTLRCRNHLDQGYQLAPHPKEKPQRSDAQPIPPSDLS
jgi:hypothetical protein